MDLGIPGAFFVMMLMTPEVALLPYITLMAPLTTSIRST